MIPGLWRMFIHFTSLILWSNDRVFFLKSFYTSFWETVLPQSSPYVSMHFNPMKKNYLWTKYSPPDNSRITYSINSEHLGQNSKQYYYSTKTDQVLYVMDDGRHLQNSEFDWEKWLKRIGTEVKVGTDMQSVLLVVSFYKWQQD